METGLKSSKQKGTEFEKEFAEYMKDKLAYNDCYLNQKVKGKISTNEYEVDIIGKKLNEQGEKMRFFGRFFLVIAILAFILFFSGVIILVENDMVILGIIGIVGWVILESGKEKMYDYTWVECKDHKRKIDKHVVNTLKDKTKDYHNSKDKKFLFSKIILVSASGIIPNALRFAKEYSIECYYKSGNKEFIKYELDNIIN